MELSVEPLSRLKNPQKYIVICAPNAALIELNMLYFDKFEF